jgi:fucose 4-O-acetylase-like acetyltransferase
MNVGLALAVMMAVAVLIVWSVVGLTRRIREERAAQALQGRSPLWLLITSGIGAYLFAYFAFGEHLQAPMRLALAALAVGSIPAIRRFLP